MAAVVLGLLIGAAISAARLPAGFDLFSLPVVPGRLAAGARAAALAAAALAVGYGLNDGRPGRGRGGFLASVALGFLVHGVLLAPRWTPPSALVLSLVVGGALAVGGLAGALAATPSPPEPDPQSAARRVGAWLGIATAAAGAALALEATARTTRVFAAGSDVTETVQAGVFLALAAFGGVAFGRLLDALPGDRARGTSVSFALAATALLALVGRMVAAGIASPRGLAGFLDRFHLNTADHGRLAFDAALAAAILVLPAFALGTAVWCTRRRGDLCALLLGGALGVAAAPWRLEEVTSATLVLEGSRIAALGALVGALASRPGLPRWLAAAGAVALGAVAVLAPSPAVEVIAPWEVRGPRASLVLETPEGLLTVESGGGEISAVTLDRRPLAPAVDEAAADAARIEASFACLPPEVWARGVEVLLVGQLTPGRALALERLGARRVDRTGAWHRSMPALEEHLFARPLAGGSIERPAGEILGFEAARERWMSGRYDLVLAPAVLGDTTLAPPVPTVPGTIVVAWIDAREGPAWRPIDRPVPLAGDGLELPAIAVVSRAAIEVEPRQDAPTFVEVGAALPPPDPWHLLTARRDERWRASTAALGRRLERANVFGPRADLTQGLAAHWAAQRRSSPFDSAEQSVELDERALVSLQLAALAGPLDPFTRQAWEHIARVLVAKRAVAEIYTWLEPLAEVWAPWPEIERALAVADLEALEPGAAVERLEPSLPAALEDPELLRLLARARGEAGDPAGAAELLERLLELQPENRGVERALALALLRADDPRGRPVAERLLAEDPEDEELARWLEAGPGARPPPR